MEQDIIAKIIGNGMIAKSMEKHKNDLYNAVIFASGVSDSTCSKQSEYNREIMLLDKTIEVCRSSGEKIVYFSSAGAVYGNCCEYKKEDSLLKPTTDYGHHKVFCEDMIINSGVNYLILRLPNLIGHDQNRKQLIPYLVDQACYGKVKLFNNAARDLLDADDFAKLTAELINNIKDKDIINLASGTPILVIKIFSEIQKILGTDADVEIVEGGDRHCFSIDKLKKMINVSFPEDYWQLTLKKYINRLYNA